MYEELLSVIKTITGDVARFVLHGNFKDAIRITPFYFVTPIAFGIVVSIFGLANILSFLLTAFPVYMWAFIFGLVSASALIILQRIPSWNMREACAVIVATAISYIVVGSIPVETPNTAFFIFLSGVIAVCALLMPGISGSFVLLLLGKYHDILTAVIDRNLQTLVVFSAGCVLGIVLFSRLLTWLFKKHHDISVAIIAGFMLGSLRKIWPWKDAIVQFDIGFLTAVLLCVFGLCLAFYIDGKKQTTVKGV